MLFNYPISATSDNWLHECLCEVIQALHAAIDPKVEASNWPDIIPRKYRAQLNRRTGLRDRLKNYGVALATLGTAEKQRVERALFEQNDFAGLFSLSHDCDTISDLPKIMQEPIESLFEFAFDLLKELEIRDKHYFLVWKYMKHKSCPFCGYEPFTAPQGPREALDHYLAESIYPLAGANLRNLVPMGYKCNSIYKNGIDILRRGDGKRRRSSDPYGSVNSKVSLVNSVPCGNDVDESEPILWVIEFEPDCEEAETWASVFDIRTRYVRDILADTYKTWLADFSAWYRSVRVTEAVTNEILLSRLEQYLMYIEATEEYGRDFLRVPTMRMIHNHCKRGNVRLIQILIDLLTLH